MGQVVNPMASEHKRIVGRLEALERRYDEDRELRRIHCEQHKRLEERQKALEERAAQHDHAHDCAASLRKAPEARLDARIDDLNNALGLASEGLSRRLSEIEARLASKPDDFGGVTSTGAPKRERRFMVVKFHGMAFSREDGYVRRCAAANPACVPPVLFERLEDAGEIIRLLDLQDAEIEPVEVIERDGRLIEARYA